MTQSNQGLLICLTISNTGNYKDPGISHVCYPAGRVYRCGKSFKLMVFARYINGPTIEEEFLFCKPLETTTKAEYFMA